ncbi:multidrug ABC transporter ATP-binding protein, partial [Bacillus cereus]
GGEKVFDGTLQVGAILAFINYLNIILMSLMSISMVFIQIARAFPSADRVQQVLNTEVDIISEAYAIEPEKIEGNIEFKNV